MPDATVTLGLDGKPLKSGLDSARRDVERFGQSTKKTLTAATSGRFAGAGKSIAGALAGLAVGSKITSTINEYARLADLSARLGVSAESIQRVGIAAEQSGTDAETAARALTLLTRALDNPDNKKAAEAFKELGVNLGELRTADAFEQVGILAKAFQKAQSTGTGFSAIMDLLGKSGAELIPLLRMTSEEMDAIAKKEIISDDQIARIAKLDDRMVELSRTVSVGLGSSIAWIADKWESTIDVITTKALQAQVIVDSLFAGNGPTAALQAGAKFAQDMADAKIKEAKEAAAAEQRALEAKRESLALTKEITKEEKKAEKPTGADTNADGFTSKREQRIFDLAQERGQRRADSIKGYSESREGGSDFARARGAQRRSESDAQRKELYSRKFGGLKELGEMNAMQENLGFASVGLRFKGVRSTDPVGTIAARDVPDGKGGVERLVMSQDRLYNLIEQRLTVD